MLRIRLLGELGLESAGRELPVPATRPGRELLAWLALHPGPHGRSRLAGALRPDAPDDAARHGVRQALWAIRRALGDLSDRYLVATRDRVGLEAREVEVDVRRLLHAAGRGDLYAAAALAGGTLLPELDEDWVVAAREEVRAELARTCADRGAAAERSGDEADALDWFRLRAKLDPLSEAAGRDLVRLLAASGDRATAVRVAGALRERLVDELGLVPSAETRSLIESVLSDDGERHSATVAPAGLDAATAPDTPRRTRPSGATRGLPSTLGAAAQGPLLGRGSELDRLRRTWTLAREGSPQLVLVGGEPGIGKSALAAAFATEVVGEGGIVLFGRCDEDPLGPYQPFVEALDRGLDDGALRVSDLAAHQAAELGRLLPRLALEGGPPPAGVDREHARYRLFDAVTGAFAAATATGPGLLVIDDLHWAEGPTCTLVSHLLRSAGGAALMVLATYRDTVVAGAGHPLARVVAELRHRADVAELSLGGLDETAVQELASRAGLEVEAPGLVTEVHRRTGGNALFVVETLKDLAERGADGAQGVEVPRAVRDVIAQRVARLGPEVLTVLRVAAAAGERFELAHLEDACDLDRGRLVEALEAALAARLVRELAAPAGSYAFSHALVAETVYMGMSSARRADLHARLGQALVERGGPAAAVSRHLLAAVPLVETELAAQWTDRAAREALGALAYEEAVALYRRVLETPVASEGSGRRARLLHGLGRALDHAGDRAGARKAFLEAADLARRTADAPLLADVALGYKGLALTITAPEPQTVFLLEEAIEAIGEADAARRARLLAALGLETYYQAPDRSNALSRQAVDLARGLADPGTLAEALSARHASLWTADGVAERLEVAEEMHAASLAAGKRLAALQARNWRVVDLLELGRVAQAREEIDAYEQDAHALRLPRYGWYVPLWRAGLAILRGDFDTAELLSEQARELGVAAGDPDADTYHRIQRTHLLIEQRRFAEVDIDWIADRVKHSPAGRGAWLGLLALLQVQTGSPDAARESFAELAANDFALLPTVVNWHAICETAEACALLSDARAARSLVPRLTPFARLNPVIARGLGSYGPLAYHLGRLATTLGHQQEAERRFEQSRQLCEEMGAHPRAALSQMRLEEIRR